MSCTRRRLATLHYYATPTLSLTVDVYGFDLKIDTLVTSRLQNVLAKFLMLFSF